MWSPGNRPPANPTPKACKALNNRRTPWAKAGAPMACAGCGTMSAPWANAAA